MNYNSLTELRTVDGIIVTLLSLIIGGFVIAVLLGEAKDHYKYGNTTDAFIRIVLSQILIVLFVITTLLAWNTGVYKVDKDEAAVVFKTEKTIDETLNKEITILKPVRIATGYSLDNVRIITAAPFIEKIKPFKLTPYKLQTPPLKLYTKLPNGDFIEQYISVILYVKIENPVKYTTSLEDPNEVLKESALANLRSIIQSNQKTTALKKSLETRKNLISMVNSVAVKYGIKVLDIKYTEQTLT